MNNVIIEKELSVNGKFFCTINGKSMIPTLYPKIDKVIIEKPEKLKKYDIILFKNDADKYILHRIVRIKDHCYNLRGDNNYIEEKNIKEDQIIGVVYKCYRNGKVINLKSFSHRIQLIWMLLTFPIRKECNKIKKMLKNIRVVL